MSSHPTGHERADHGHPDIDDVQHLIEEAHEAENRLHQMAPFQLQTDEYVANGWSGSDHERHHGATGAHGKG